MLFSVLDDAWTISALATTPPTGTRQSTAGTFRASRGPGKILDYAVFGKARTLVRRPRALMACHRSHFAWSVNQI